MNTDNAMIPEPPKVLQAIRSGFDSITNHPGLVLFPALLDCLLWFGPRLSVKRQIEGLIVELNSISSYLSDDFSEMMATSQQIWEVAAERINLMAALRSYPVGVFSLLSSILPLENPVGIPIRWEIESFSQTVLIILGLFCVGTAIGGVFFAAVRQVALFDNLQWRKILRSWPRYTGQSLLMSGIFLVLLLAVFILGSCVATGFAFFSIALGQAVILVIGVFSFWILYPLFFAPHGIFVSKLKAWKAMLESVKLTNLTFFKSGLFILFALVITQGLDMLWQVSPESSWLMMISILGHSFVATGVLAASFVYYQDMVRWVSEMKLIRGQEETLRGQSPLEK